MPQMIAGGKSRAAAFAGVDAGGIKPALIFECVGHPRDRSSGIRRSARGDARIVWWRCMENDRSEPMLGIHEELTFNRCWAIRRKNLRTHCA